MRSNEGVTLWVRTIDGSSFAVTPHGRSSWNVQVGELVGAGALDTSTNTFWPARSITSIRAEVPSAEDRP